MSVNRKWLPRFRHTPMRLKTGWFSSRIVQVLEQQYHDTGEYHSPDVSGQYCPLTIDRKGWGFVNSHPATLVNIGPCHCVREEQGDD